MNRFSEAAGIVGEEHTKLYSEYENWCKKHGGMLPCWQGFMTWKICQLEAKSNTVESCGCAGSELVV